MARKYKRGKKTGKSRSGYRRKKYGKKWGKSKKSRRVTTVMKTVRPKGVSRRTSMKSETMWIDYAKQIAYSILPMDPTLIQLPVFRTIGKDIGLLNYFPSENLKTGTGPVYNPFNGPFSNSSIKGTQIVLKYIDVRFDIYRRLTGVMPLYVADALRLIIVKSKDNNLDIPDLLDTNTQVGATRTFNRIINTKKYKVLYDKQWAVSTGVQTDIIYSTPFCTPVKMFRFILPFKCMAEFKQDMTTGTLVQPQFLDDIQIWVFSRQDTRTNTTDNQSTNWQVGNVTARWYYKDP